MSALFSVVILLLLLLFIKQAIPTLHPLFAVIFTLIFLQVVAMQTIIPWARSFHAMVQSIPYAQSLLYTAVVLLLSEVILQLLTEHEYDTLGEIMHIAVRISLIVYWLAQLQPIIEALTNLLQKVQ